MSDGTTKKLTLFAGWEIQKREDEWFLVNDYGKIVAKFVANPEQDAQEFVKDWEDAMDEEAKMARAGR